MEKFRNLSEEEILDIGIKRGRKRSIISLLTIVLVFIIIMYITDKDNLKNLIILFTIVVPITLILGFKLQKITIKNNEDLRNKMIDDTKKYLSKSR